jgi:uncharacterized SAM-binding protein YcdF (DUF218 family)
VYEALKLLIASFVLPPGGPLVLVVFGLLALHRFPRAGRALALAGAAVLWLCSLPVVANGLVTALGGATPLDMEAARTADAIVILGGGVRQQAPEYGGDTLGRLTLERVRYGAHLARQTGLPVLVTGGRPDTATQSEADLMRAAMQSEYGMTVGWVDDSARNTQENARNAARLLLAEGRRTVVLVMHGFDVRRARGLFEEAGLRVVPAPTRPSPSGRSSPSDFLPSADAIVTAHFALYETLALLREALRGPG